MRVPRTTAARAMSASLGAAARGAVATHIYVSEGRNRDLIARLTAAGTAAGATLVNEFVDAPYHRTGITLASADPDSLLAGVAAVCGEALRALDFRAHTASHPRVGIVDHIACNPLGATTCDEAGALAVRIGRCLGEAEPAVPVYLYGAARSDGRRLAELRRSLGYFGGAAQGEWCGLLPEMAGAMGMVPPDFGPAAVDERYGAAVVGAVPFVHNYNVLVNCAGGDDPELMVKCRQIARAVSSRGGGLPAVETMALSHGKGVEVACNLLDVSVTPAPEVLRRITALCETAGLTVADEYFTNKRPDELLALVRNQE